MSRERRWSPGGLVIALTLVAVAAGCSGGDDNKEANAQSTTTVGEAVDAARACGLITKAEVEAAIGTRVNDGQSSGGGSTTAACKYEVAGTQQAVIVAISTGTDPADFQKAKASTPDVQAVPGAGPDTFVSGGKAFVLKGTNLALVAVNIDRPVPTLTEAAKKLAQAASGRL